MPEDLAAFPQGAELSDQETAQLPGQMARAPESLSTPGAPLPEPSSTDSTQVTEVTLRGDFTQLSLPQLLQLDLVLPQGAMLITDALEVPQGDAEVVDLTELSLLELMNVRVAPEPPPELPDLNPDDTELLPQNDEGLWQDPPSHLAPDGGLTPIGVLPGTDYIPPPPPPLPPPPPETNDAPTANDVSATGNEDAASIRITLRGTDPDPGGAVSFVRVEGLPGNGTLYTTSALTVAVVVGALYPAAGGSRNLFFVPDSNYNGTETFQYTVIDNSGAADPTPATATITVNPRNDAPVAQDDGNGTDAVIEDGDSSATGNVLTNDSDIDAGDSLTVASAGLIVGTYGSLVLAADGSWTYTLDNADSDTDSLADGQTAADTFTYTVADGSGATDTANLVIAITGANDAPVAIDDGNGGDAVVENTDATASGNVLTNDQDADSGDSLTVTSAGIIAGIYGSLTLAANGAWTYTLDNLDPDTNSLANGQTVTETFSYTITDNTGASDTADLVATITGANDAPSAPSLISGGAVDENSADGASVAFMSATDPDLGAVLTYSLIDDAGGRFAIDPSTGEITVADGNLLDFESNPSHQVVVQVSDGGLSTTTTLTVTVNDVNETPTDIALAGAAVDENDAGAAIGAVTVADPDAGDSHTFAVSDARFEVVGGQLQLAAGASLDFESEASVSVDVTATDSGGLSRTETFVIAVNDVNETPTDIALAGATVDENDAGAVIGAVTVADPDAGDSHTFAVSDARFEVVGGQLQLAAGASLDFESEASVTVDVTATDSGGLDRTETFVIAVNDLNEAPGPASFATGGAVDENSANGTVVGTVAAGDPDLGDSVAYSLSDNAGGRFAINSATGEITVIASALLDYETGGSHDITVVADDGSLASSTTLTISINDINEAPGASAFASGGAVDENSADGSLVGIIAASDPDLGDSVTYSLVDDAGGRFVIDAATGELTVANGLLLDFESGTSHDITVVASDGALSSSTTLSIAVNAVDPENVTGDAAANSLRGGTGDDTLSGLDGDDTLDGGADNDNLSGDAGNDTLVGGSGDDTLYGGSGNDTIDVSADNDTVGYSSTLDGTDVIDGFDGDATGGQDVFDLDGLFDSLGVLAVDRDARVSIVDDDGGAAGPNWSVSVDTDGDLTFELAVAAIASPDTITVGSDVLVGS